MLFTRVICHSSVENFLKRPVWSWRSEFFFCFGLADDQTFFNTSYNNIFLHFWRLVSFLLKTLQEQFHPIKYYLCWICTSNKDKALKTIKFSFSVFLWNLLRSKFWNHFQAEITLWSPIFLDYFPTVLQKSCESWFIRFWVSRYSKTPKISVNTFFCVFEPPLWNY